MENTITCLVCRVVKKVRPCLVEKRKTCSMKCRNIYLKKYTFPRKHTWGDKISVAKKGVPVPLEIRERIAKTLTGRKLTKNHRKNISKGNYKRWENHIKTTPQNKVDRIRFRNEMQKKVFKRDNYTCQLCGVKGKKMQVDHIQSWAEYVDLRFSMDNCRTLCMDCHYQITYGRSKPKNITWGHNLERRSVLC